ncbi:MAG: peptidase C39 family protein [Acidobacteria bacterium]|nr:peptidase C39 family protein [Acidobacteriota bacterium]
MAVRTTRTAARRPPPAAVRLSVPYYAQTSEFSCGPACVLMALGHLDRRRALTRRLEFEVWRQCNMIGVRGADPLGLSVPLLEAGHDVLLVMERRRAFDTRKWMRTLVSHGFDPEDALVARFGIEQNRQRAQARGLAFRRERPTVRGIHDRMRDGWIAIALVHMGLVHELDIPHWVAVTGTSATHVTFHDPYPPRGRKGLRATRREFQRILDDVQVFGMSPAVVFVRARRRG